MLTEAQERALIALYVPGYFGLNLFETIAYRLTRIAFYRHEVRLARRLLERMDNLLPLTNYSRSGLLGMLDAWDIAGDISPQMFTMLQITVQDRKYWAEEIREV